jgi:hypothetical protein
VTRCPKCGERLVCHRCVSVKGGRVSSAAKRAASRLTLAKARAEKKRKAALPCTSQSKGRVIECS